MKRKKMILYGFFTTLIVVGFLAWKYTSRTAYEAAEYTVVESEGDFEIRDYPELVLATTEMRSRSPEGDGSGDGSFMRLFGYISGENEQQQKVAMTVPVFMEAGDSEESGQMGFVVPKQVAADNVPEPTSTQVKVRKRPGGRFAVIRFSGKMTEAKIAEAKAKLEKWLAEKELVGKDNYEFAGYDPPWTPGFL
ncbi:MAG: heme-binding protein, partial [Lacipirellulaceae bacterium]